ncbi:hypothetical protein NK983_25695, partial [Salmonella enterica subsp. enterica serovar Typhimurium]|nr:hypothetical protein [Salmonella enterica subsp. enterica serovar Typhimurium]
LCARNSFNRVADAPRTHAVTAAHRVAHPLEMTELFDATMQNISLHRTNLFHDGELDSAAAVKESLTVQTEDVRQVERKMMLYNLDAIVPMYAQ